MPYQSGCNCFVCETARNLYDSDDNRARHVAADEAGASREEQREYVGRHAGSFAPTSDPAHALAWIRQYRAEQDEARPCNCGNCEECGYADSESHAYGESESMLTDNQRGTIAQPLLHLLRRGGRYFSAEVEVNGLDPDDAARALGCDTDGYGAKPSRIATIVATDDCTVDAEIKLGRFRDGATHTANARAVYDTLRRHDAFCAANTGHHVHVDATRLVDAGQDAVERVLRASLTLANATETALRPLASSGYDGHRDPSGMGYGGNLKSSVRDALNARTGWHASNAYEHVNYGNGIPTFEYRLPNGTLEPIRAHAHIAVALGLLDFGERCYDNDPEARTIERQAADRIAHAKHWSEADSASILSRALHLHPDSLHALALAADTGPANKQHRDAWRIAARSAA